MVIKRLLIYNLEVGFSSYYIVVANSGIEWTTMLHCRRMLWIDDFTLPQDGFRKRTTAALYSIVNQLDTVRTVYLE